MPPPGLSLPHVPAAGLADFSVSVLAAVGVCAASRKAATAAMLHGSRLGIDSHGIRLLPHYVEAFSGGRLNKAPTLHLTNGFGAVATLDAGDAHGAHATYEGMEHAVRLAERYGIGAVAIRRSSHFGPAGAFAVKASERGCIGIVMGNSDSFVRLHEGAERFHGTNPIAMAAPSGGRHPWLLDMATSAVPFNRVQLYRSLGRDLPAGVASDEAGRDTKDPDLAEMLAPLGGAFGFKGAALAGMAEILSAGLSGARFSPEIPPMGGPDYTTPRNLGAFVLAIRPDAFLPQGDFEAGMARYLAALRASRPAIGASVLAPGDREWAEADSRAARGIPIDRDTQIAFHALSQTYGIALPAGLTAG
ncbi:Ldh family oxidoreductase [Roseibium aquae]|uniref:Ldh family oxidoreductase n=1 Tax=Roseibium aquae TaxID=1323746 RepID=UPI001562066D